MSRLFGLLLWPTLLTPNAPPCPAQEPAPAKITALKLARTFPLEGVQGSADSTGILGRIDHLAYHPAAKCLYIACVANGSLEAIDLETGRRCGRIEHLQGPQGVVVSAQFVFFSTGEDGKLHRCNQDLTGELKSVEVGEDADNVRAASDGKIWVSSGGHGPGALSCFDPQTLKLTSKIHLPRMPEGFQLDPTGTGIFANLPAGKRSAADGTVVGFDRTTGAKLWERKLSGRGGNYPMNLDPAHDRIFIATRHPARLISLNSRDGTILGEAPCPPQSDDLFFDPQSGLVVVIGGGELPASKTDPGGAGAALDIFAINGSGQPSRLGGSPLPPHSRTGTIAPDRRALFVAIPAAQDRPAEIREYRLPN